jgi:hypothetical protein
MIAAMPRSSLSLQGACVATISCALAMLATLALEKRTFADPLFALPAIFGTIALCALIGWFTPVLLRLPRRRHDSL